LVLYIEMHGQQDIKISKLCFKEQILTNLTLES